MEITFTDKKLEKIVNDDYKMLKEFDQIRAKEVVEIIDYHKEK